jgi:Domain of unknown function (DUF1858)
VSHCDFPILPSTKVGALLDRYPQLEDILIALAPPFKKLRNPLLRKGVAKVASLKQAAAVGGVPVNDLVNKLRAAVGQETIASEDAGESISYFSTQPEWFASSKIVISIDERAADPNKMPIVAVLQKAARLQAGEMLELITTFLPAPGIEIMKKKGLRVWSVQQGPELIRTYVSNS